MTWPDPAAERLWVALTGTGRLRLGHGEVWKAWIGDDQGRSGSLDEYDRVIGLLADLEAAGRLRRSRKRTARGLPAQVTLLGVASPRRQVSAHGWRPELQWVPTARLSGRRLQQLLRINEWLRDRPEDLPTVPVAERSLDIFGRHGEPEPEKLLERLWPTLFQSGRTDPRALAVEQISLPFSPGALRRWCHAAHRGEQGHLPLPGAARVGAAGGPAGLRCGFRRGGPVSAHDHLR